MRFRLPSRSQPSLPTSTGFSPISPVSTLTSCHLTISPQIFFSFFSHALIADFVVGMSFLRTSEKVWGPTCFGLVVLSIFSVVPASTVFGPSKNRSLPSCAILIVVVFACVRLRRGGAASEDHNSERRQCRQGTDQTQRG